MDKVQKYNSFNVLPPAWISSARIWSVLVNLYLFSFPIAISASEELVPGTADQVHAFLSA
jgi:hypothetical protein